VKNFSAIAAPLNALTKKDQTLVWSDEAHATFLTLRDAFISVRILATPNDKDKFILDAATGNQSI